jgi:hypothetical protein
MPSHPLSLHVSKQKLGTASPDEANRPILGTHPPHEQPTKFPSGLQAFPRISTSTFPWRLVSTFEAGSGAIWVHTHSPR